MGASPRTGTAVVVAASLLIVAGARADGACGAGPGACGGAAGEGFYVEAAALWLERGRGDSRVLGQEFQFPGVATVVDTIQSGSVSYDFEPGLRIGAGYRLTGRDALEGSGFGLQAWSESVGLRNSNTTGFPTGPNTISSQGLAGINVVGGSPLANFTRVDTLDADMSSDVHGLRLGYRRRVGDAGDAWLGVDFRYLELHDELVLTARGPAPGVALATDRSRTQARNELYGGQLAGRSTLRRGRFSVRLAAGAGLYYNRTRQRIREQTDAPVVPAATGQTLVDVSGSEDVLATIFELDVTAAVRVHRNVRLQAGYQLMALGGLALAPSQLRFIGAAPTTNVVDADAGTDHDDHLLLQGLHVGLRVEW